MTNIKLFFIALVLTSCSEGTIADKSVWSLHGTVFWHGSERPIAKAEVTVYDPFSNEKRFIDVTESDINGHYSFTSNTDREAVDIEATVDGRQYIVDVKRAGKSVSRRLSDLSSVSPVDLYLQGYGVLDLEITRGKSHFSYGMITGSIDSFFIFSVDFPLRRTVNVLAEHSDSIRIILYDDKEHEILNTHEHFELRNNKVLPLKLDL